MKCLFNPWSEDHHPTETFMRIVREMQIQPNAYYLEATKHQTLSSNFGMNSYQPKLTVIEQENSQDEEPNGQIQSPVLLIGKTICMLRMTLIMRVQHNRTSD